MLKMYIWFELSRVELYRNDPKGKKYCEFNSGVIRVTENDITVNV